MGTFLASAVAFNRLEALQNEPQYEDYESFEEYDDALHEYWSEIEYAEYAYADDCYDALYDDEGW